MMTFRLAYIGDRRARAKAKALSKGDYRDFYLFVLTAFRDSLGAAYGQACPTAGK